MSVSMEPAAAARRTLDPWADASFISQHLRQPGAELLVVLGAEAWCPKCKRLRPAFEQMCQVLPAHILWLWLDLEDHAEFLGNFIPPNLPLLLRWRAGQCVQAAVLQDIDVAASDLAQCVRMQPLTLQGEHLVDAADEFLLPLPALWQQLAGGCDVELRAA